MFRRYPVISNTFNFLVAGAYLPYALETGVPVETILINGLFGLVVAIGFFITGAAQGGASKLIGALSVWLGPSSSWLTFIALSMLSFSFVGTLVDKFYGSEAVKRIPFLPFAAGAAGLIALHANALL